MNDSNDIMNSPHNISGDVEADDDSSNNNNDGGGGSNNNNSNDYDPKMRLRAKNRISARNRRRRQRELVDTLEQKLEELQKDNNELRNTCESLRSQADDLRFKLLGFFNVEDINKDKSNGQQQGDISSRNNNDGYNGKNTDSFGTMVSAVARQEQQGISASSASPATADAFWAAEIQRQLLSPNAAILNAYGLAALNFSANGSMMPLHGSIVPSIQSSLPTATTAHISSSSSNNNNNNRNKNSSSLLSLFSIPDTANNINNNQSLMQQLQQQQEQQEQLGQLRRQQQESTSSNNKRHKKS